MIGARSFRAPSGSFNCLPLAHASPASSSSGRSRAGAFCRTYIVIHSAIERSSAERSRSSGIQETLESIDLLVPGADVKDDFQALGACTDPYVTFSAELRARANKCRMQQQKNLNLQSNLCRQCCRERATGARASVHLVGLRRPTTCNLYKGFASDTRGLRTCCQAKVRCISMSAQMVCCMPSLLPNLLPARTSAG